MYPWEAPSVSPRLKVCAYKQNPGESLTGRNDKSGIGVSEHTAFYTITRSHGPTPATLRTATKVHKYATSSVECTALILGLRVGCEGDQWTSASREIIYGRSLESEETFTIWKLCEKEIRERAQKRKLCFHQFLSKQIWNYRTFKRQFRLDYLTINLLNNSIVRKSWLLSFLTSMNFCSSTKLVCLFVCFASLAHTRYRITFTQPCVCFENVLHIVGFPYVPVPYFSTFMGGTFLK